MVNRKFITHNGQIISSNTGDIISTLSGLEVEDIGDSNTVSGLLASDVSEGDLLYKIDTILEAPSGLSHLNPVSQYGYKCRFYEEDGLLKFEIEDNGYCIIFTYENEKWVYNLIQGSRVSSSVPRMGNPSNHNYSKTTAYGKRVEVGYTLDSRKGRRGSNIRVYDEDGFSKEIDPFVGLNRSDMPIMNDYSNFDGTREVRYSRLGTQVFTDSSGVVHVGIAYQGAATTGNAELSSNNYGNGNFKMYTLNDKFKASPVTFDTSSFGRRVNGISFMEVSGTVYMCHAMDQAYIGSPDANFPLSSTDPLYPVGHHIATSIYKWNPSTRHWGWHQFDYQRRPMVTYYSDVPIHLDASTHLFQRNGSTGIGAYSPLKYQASSGYFEQWGEFDNSALPITGYGGSKIIKNNNDYYLFAAGAIEYRYSFEGSSTGHYLTTSVNKDLSGNPNKIEDSVLRLYKYNESNDHWENLAPSALKMRFRRVSPGTNTGTRIYTYMTDAITYNGEVFLAAAAHGYGDNYKIFKFDPDTESVTDITPDWLLYGPAMRNNYRCDDITKSGVTYRLKTHGDYPYVTVFEYHTSGDNPNRWTVNKYHPDFVSSSRFAGAWYETSSGELYGFVSHNNNVRLNCFLYDTSFGQLKKIADTNLNTSATIPSNVQIYSVHRFDLSGKHYLITNGLVTPYLYEITEDASGVPFLLDTSTTVPTMNGGTITGNSDDVIIHDGKMFYARNAYNSPFYGPEIYSWDGVASTWTEVSSVTDAYTTADASALVGYRNTSYMGRSYLGIRFFKLNDEFYYLSQNDSWPYEIIWKYNSSNGKFEEVSEDAYGRGGTPINIPYSSAVWNNKFWWTYYTNLNAGDKASFTMKSFDGSSIERYPCSNIKQPLANNSQLKGDFYITPDNKLQFLGSWTDLLGTSRLYEVNQDFLNNDGLVWCTNNELSDLHNIRCVGVAMENGSRGDKINIRKVNSL